MGTTESIEQGVPDVEDVFDELEELEEIVDSPEERQQVRETMRTLRRTRRTGMFGRIRDSFDSRDVGEGVVGSFVFGIPMIVEGGTLEIGAFLATSPLAFVGTVAFGFVLVAGILHAVEVDKIEEDLLLGTIPLRLLVIPAIALTLATVLMVGWGRVDLATPRVAAGQTLVTAVVMAVGASLGDALPGT
ncbi:MAG: hypothetical protein ABEH35_01205 [Haloarculaceae archaeon]